MRDELFSSCLRRCFTFVMFVLAGFTSSVFGQQQTGYLDYDPATGALSFDDLLVANPPTTIELVSILGVYTGERPARYSLFDVYSKHKFFTLTPSGLPSPDFGPLMASGIEPELLAADLCLSGSRLRGGPLSGIQLRTNDQAWPLSGDPAACRAVPHIPRVTIEPIDFYLDYDSGTGRLAIDSTNQQVMYLNLRSPDLFTGNRPDFFDGKLDVYTPSVLSYVDLVGFETIDFGEIIQPGLPPQRLAESLCYSARTIESSSTGELFVRSDGEIYAIACNSRREPPPVSIEQLNEVVDQPVDVGIVIDPDDGSLIVHVPEIPDGASKPLTSIEIKSDDPIFIPGGQYEGTLDGILDSLTSRRLFKSDSNGFGTVNFGPILLPGVSGADVESLIQVTGLFADGAAVDSVQVVEWNFVPEPSGMCLVVLGLPMLHFIRGRLV